MIKVAIVEIGGSHDECILTQVIALKQTNCYVVFCGTSKMYHSNFEFEKFFDEFHEITLPQSMLGDFFCMRNLNKWFLKNKITKVILNTAQGGHMRNLCLTSNKSIKFYGILHTIKLLQGSFTQSLISKKVKDYFVLNDQLMVNAGKVKGLNLHSFYPLDYPIYDLEIAKPEDEIWITVIGGVENRRKDLSGFVNFAKETTANIRFIFLGKSDVNHPDVIDFKSHLDEKNLNSKVKLFDDFVTQAEFDAYLKVTDGILPLVHPGTPSAEEYFSRQISGAINVAFSYKIPMMIHEHYNQWEDFNQGIVFYSLENLNSRFVDFCGKLISLKQDLQQNQKFSKELQQKKFSNVVLK